MIQERLTKQHWKWLLVATFVGTATLVAALTAYNPLFGIAISVITVGSLIAAYLICRPWHLYALYVFLLTPHVLLMAILLVQVGLPAPVVKAISAWKEATMLLFLGVAGWRFLQSSSRWRITIPDIFVLLYLVYVLAYFTLSLLNNLSTTVLLYGLRDLTLPVFLYLIGRSVPLTPGWARRVFRWLLWAALIYSLIGVIEVLFIPVEWHIDIGIAQYYRELVGIDYSTRGLPENYWRGTPVGRLRRAASVTGSSQGFALFFLSVLPATIYGVYHRKLPESSLAIVAFTVSMLGLWLTITRFTIVIGVGLFFLAGAISSRQARQWLIYGLVTLVFVSAVGYVASPTFRTVIITTVNWQDHSSSLRLRIWAETAEVILQQPIGYGIGQVGHTVRRFVANEDKLVGIEGQMSKIGVELGVPGLLLYLAMIIAIAAYLIMRFARVEAPYIRALCYASALTFVGLFVNSLTTEWHNAPLLVYPAWWLAGSCVTSIVHNNRALRQREFDVQEES